jgi:hypothetical protein
MSMFREICSVGRARILFACKHQRATLTCRSMSILCLSFTFLLSSGNAQQQSLPASESGAKLDRLVAPVYPRPGQVAHIVGDVDLTVNLRKDGSVESVQALSGHPMLTQVAVESAGHSVFSCPGCNEPLTSYPLRYRFQIAPLEPEKACLENGGPPPPSPEVDLIHHQVTVFAWEVWTCDPTVKTTTIRFRSAKCLYLWRCGRRTVESTEF